MRVHIVAIVLTTGGNGGKFLFVAQALCLNNVVIMIGNIGIIIAGMILLLITGNGVVVVEIGTSFLLHLGVELFEQP